MSKANKVYPSSEVEGDNLEGDSSEVFSENQLEKEFVQGYIDDSIPISQEISSNKDDDFQDIAKHEIVQVAGDDSFGRKLIVFSACRLPPSKELNHARLLMYLKKTLDQYVENDYTLVYFHHGLNKNNKPSLSWLRQAYKEFDRKYKKNLKALYLVHPTKFIRILWAIFKPFISIKFGRKVTYVNYLPELAQQLPLDQLIVPKEVWEYDNAQVERYKPQLEKVSIPAHQALPTQQFGVSLKFIKDGHNGDVIPTVMRSCVMYLREHGLDTEGLFRRSASATTLKEVQKLFNEGASVDFASLQDIHIPAATLKSFLRQLPEPLLTFDLYDNFVEIQTYPDSQRRESALEQILHKTLPDDNYTVLKYLISFLKEVEARSEMNKMSAENLAIVFGPNLLWPRSQASLTSVGYANQTARMFLIHYDRLFAK